MISIYNAQNNSLAIITEKALKSCDSQKTNNEKALGHF